MSDVTRRDLLGRSSALALGLLLGNEALARAEELSAQAPQAPKLPEGPAPSPVTVAVIGANERGREILTSLSYVKGAVVKYVCDTYTSAGFQKKAMENAPKATYISDYKKVLDDPAVQGVFVATPTHLHKQVVLDALAAGKHVYCEAPLAHTVEEARQIAIAGRDAKTIFQAGLQNRTNGQHHHVKHFVEIGAVGSISRCTAQWNQKSTWRRTAPNDDREVALNWRHDPALSLGLVGEIGIHQIDVMSWYLKKFPRSVMGFGSGEGVARTVTCVVEYPDNIRLTYDATLGNSFGGSFEMLQGDQSAVLLRGARAWMFKEADANALGWEVYARKEQVGDDQGIMLVANASKILAQGLEPKDFVNPKPNATPLFYACDTFLQGIRVGKEKSRPTVPVVKEGEAWSAPDPVAGDASAEIGFAATVVAIKANEAIKTGTKITLTKEMLTL
jgi:predicted dehydrogenase